MVRTHACGPPEPYRQGGEWRFAFKRDEHDYLADSRFCRPQYTCVIKDHTQVATSHLHLLANVVGKSSLLYVHWTFKGGNVIMNVTPQHNGILYRRWSPASP